MKKRFKPGDRVRLRTGSPVMIVQRYAREYSRWIGWHESSISVECTYLEYGKYKRKIIHQNNLIRVKNSYRMNNQVKNSNSFKKMSG